MALYFLDYDLRKQRDYGKLYQELNRIGAKRMLESSWCFTMANVTTATLRDHFAKFIDNDDGLWVATVTDWASRGVKANPNQLATA